MLEFREINIILFMRGIAAITIVIYTLTLLLSWRRMPTRILPTLLGKTMVEIRLGSNKCPEELKWRLILEQAHLEIEIFCPNLL